MASLTKDNRLLFKAPDGKRKTIRLGKLPKKQAQGIQRHLERLIACQIDGSAPPDETSRWLSGVSDTLHKRLEAAGLVAPKVDLSAMLLGSLIETYKGRSSWAALKPSTRQNQTASLGYLAKHFGKDRPITRITVADAQDFYAALRLPKTEPGGFGLAKSTANLAATVANALINYAIDAEMLHRNPFKSVPKGACKGDNAFVSEADSLKVLAAMKGTEEKLIFALARWGGLRMPSEPMGLRWCDIDWEGRKFLVHSPKTERHEGHERRWVPIFPELDRLFSDRYDEATAGDVYVLPSLQGRAARYADWILRRVLRRAGIEMWPRIWHSLRSTRQTELEADYPSYVVCAWLGNNELTARKHYLQVTEEHFAKAAQKAAQQMSARGESKVQVAEGGISSK